MFTKFSFFQRPKFLKKSLGLFLFLSFSLGAFAKNADREIPKGTVHRHSVGIGLGQTFLHSDFSKIGDDKIAFPDFFYAFTASHTFDIVANIHSSKHEKGGSEITLPGFAASIKGKIFEFDDFSPFVMGGLGFYRPDTTNTDNKTVFGFNLGLGVDLRLTNQFKVGLLLQHHDPFDVKQKSGPDLEGSYTKFLLTLFYTFF
ncbi:MAG: outer membrane beta-barrel protein [Bacteriovoracaceae bacterium]|nr:outer membrane beta-barrel protein [Bacteriovoracaceae bacterium]